MVKAAYKAGLVSSILTKNASDPPALDPKLCAIFGNNKYAVKQEQQPNIQTGNGTINKKSKKKLKAVKSAPSEAPKKKLKAVKAETDEKSKKKLKVIKSESTEATASQDGTVVKKQKKNKKKKGSENGVASVEVASTETPKDKKSKKKRKLEEVEGEEVKPKRKKMKKIINNEYDVVSRKRALKKQKSGLALKTQKPKKGTRVDRDNDKIIADFEKELEAEGEEGSDDNEDEVKEKKPAETTALKNFELNAPKEKDTEKERRTVFIGNLPTDVKEKTVLKLFKEHGKVEAIRFRGAIPVKPYLLKKVALNQKKLNPDQYNLTSFVRYATREEAEKAAEAMNGFEINKHHLIVDLADNKQHDNKRAIFVGNLPLRIHEDELRAFFEECGPISSVRIIRNAVTGLGKGFGYVNFQTPECVELALKKEGEEVGGRAVRVSRAVKKEKKTKEQILKKKADDLALRQQVNKKNAQKRIALKTGSADDISFTGDKRAEKGSKKSKKPNKGEIRKARIAAKLTGNSTTQAKKLTQKKSKKRLSK